MVRRERPRRRVAMRCAITCGNFFARLPRPCCRANALRCAQLAPRAPRAAARWGLQVHQGAPHMLARRIAAALRRVSPVAHRSVAYVAPGCEWLDASAAVKTGTAMVHSSLSNDALDALVRPAHIALRSTTPPRCPARFAAAPCRAARRGPIRRFRLTSSATAAAPHTPPPELRPYQADNVADILAALACTPPPAAAMSSSTLPPPQVSAAAASPSPPRLLYVLPTGGGKTVVLAAVMHAIVARGQRCLFLHRQELVNQCVAQLGRRGVECGVIMVGTIPRPREPIQVASVQTLSRRTELDHGRFDLLIIDEAHHAVAPSYAAVAARWPAAALLGATSTPFRLDGTGLRPPFETLLAGPSLRTLTQAGHLVPATVRFATTVNTRGLKLDSAGVDYNISELAGRLGRTPEKS